MKIIKFEIRSQKLKQLFSSSSTEHQEIDTETTTRRLSPTISPSPTASSNLQMFSPTNIKSPSTPSPPLEMPPRTNKHGLFHLNPPAPSFVEGIEWEGTYLLDIVALHGITGDAYTTWTHGKYFWLRDTLPKKLPGARIFSYGYDASAFSLAEGGLEDFARVLLEFLKSKRRSVKDQQRSIVFICHSMGGLVAKKALIIASTEKHYKNVAESTTGVIFLATPHHGSDQTTFPLVLASIANIALTGTSRYIGEMRTDLIASLKKDSPTLMELTTEFHNRMPRVLIASFIEQNKTWPVPKRIVDDISGNMRVDGERIIPMPDCNHKTICRFKNEGSSSFEAVWGVLEEWTARSKRTMDEKFSAKDLACLRALAFPEMTYRQQAVDDAHPNTCSWVFSHVSYRQWLARRQGLLWVKGKPGAGKSTLMAYIHRHLQSISGQERQVILSYFFHGRGSMLQKTALGMFRSFLHQLFTRASVMRDPIRELFLEKESLGEHGQGWEWQLKELQDIFSHAVVFLARKCLVTIFVDALDEAEAQAQELVDYFHNLNDRLVSENTTARICISCRHYPIISLIPGLLISVEHENHKDIAIFVQDQLRLKVVGIRTEPNSMGTYQKLENQIVGNAYGVFHWARLAVQMAIEQLNDGDSLDHVYETLVRVPKDLGDVYEHILKNVIKDHHKARTLQLMQWVCLAERPLSVTELRYAMASDNLQFFQTSLNSSKDFVDTDDRMKKLMRSLSGGLVELRQYRNRVIVQFIHQSVQDFLLSDGLIHLVSECPSSTTSVSPGATSLSRDEVIGRCEQQLSRSCIKYLALEEICQETREWGGGAENEDPFIRYAAEFWHTHAGHAEARGVLQTDLARLFEDHPQIIDTWMNTYFKLGIYSGHLAEDAKLIHVASLANLPSVVEVLLQRGVSAEEKDIHHETALHYAAKCGHTKLAMVLLNAGAQISARGKLDMTPLIEAAQYGREEVVELFLAKGAEINTVGTYTTPLQAAADRGSITLVQKLLDHGAEINLESRQYCNALQAAAAYPVHPDWISKKHIEIVHLLLEKGADLNAQGGEFGNPLQAAAYSGNVELVNLFLSLGVDVHAQGGKFGNALGGAAASSNTEVVQLLLPLGFDINARCGNYCNALEAAVQHGQESTVRLLMDKGAEINADSGKPILTAVTFARDNILKLLLDAGADTNVGDDIDGPLIQMAVSKARLTTVQTLLEGGVDVNTHGGRYGSALHAAVRRGYKAKAEFLITHGADIHYQDPRSGTPLQLAAVWGQTEMAKMLLDKGAEINVHGNGKGTPLQEAREASNECDKSAVIQLLLNKGADPNIIVEKPWRFWGDKVGEINVNEIETPGVNGTEGGDVDRI